MSSLALKTAMLAVQRRLDPDAAQWRSAVRVAGATVGDAQALRVSRLVRSLKAAGVWSTLDRLWLFAAENSTQALIDVKARGTATLTHISTSDPAFVANTGFLGNRNGYINSGYNPATNGVNYTQLSASFGYYCYVDAAPVNGDRYCGSDSHTDTNYSEYTTTQIGWGINSAGVGFTHGGSLTGFFQFNRTGANAAATYQNGVQNQTSVNSTSAIVSENFNFLCSSNSGVPYLPCEAGFSIGYLGGGMSAGQLAAMNTAIRTYLTAMGVP